MIAPWKTSAVSPHMKAALKINPLSAPLLPASPASVRGWKGVWGLWLRATPQNWPGQEIRLFAFILKWGFFFLLFTCGKATAMYVHIFHNQMSYCSTPVQTAVVLYPSVEQAVMLESPLHGEFSMQWTSHLAFVLNPSRQTFWPRAADLQSSATCWA